MAHLATVTVNADTGQFTDWIEARGSKLVDVSISGTLAASTITIQRSYDGTTALDVETHTAEAERVLQSGAFKYFRAGCKSGEYGGADDVDIRIEAGNAY